VVLPKLSKLVKLWLLQVAVELSLALLVVLTGETMGFL